MNREEYTKWWTDKAPVYFTDKIWKFSMPSLISKLNIKKDTRVLEIGFGYGRELSQFCLLSDYVYGIELTAWACTNTLLELKERKINSLPILSDYDGYNIPFKDLLFDVIYSCFVIQHLSRDHAKELIKNSLQSLNNNGVILFEFFGDFQYFNNGHDVFSGIDGQGGMFNNAYIKTELALIIKDCSGEVEWIQEALITKTWNNYWVCFKRVNDS